MGQLCASTQWVTGLLRSNSWDSDSPGLGGKGKGRRVGDRLYLSGSPKGGNLYPHFTDEKPVALRGVLDSYWRQDKTLGLRGCKEQWDGRV